MKGAGQIVTAFVVCAAVIMAVTGCEEQNLSDTKINRLMAAENIQLREQLEQCNKEIEKYQQEGKTCEEKSAMESQLLSELHIEQYRKMREEKEGLKAQIEQLKKELEELKKQMSVPEAP